MNSEIYKKVSLLVVYQGVFDNAIGQAFITLLATDNVADFLKAYGQLFQALASRNISWNDFLIEQILLDDNPFSQQVQKKSVWELPESLINGFPAWEVDNKLESFLHSSLDWTELVEDLADYYRECGTGIFARYQALRWQEGRLQGITHPDPVQIQEIVGYEMPKETLIKNTEFLLAGYPALNVLLYGSRGSGKSSLVKGLLQKYHSQGLRLIEVAKSQLKDLPLIIEILRDLPQKFIIFVDDLSFEEDDEAFKALKVVLEGSITARPKNVVVYATSNRRHLVREFFADRPRPKDGDEVHNWDTVQEKLSFSDRFGLTLTFEPANQEKYLKIVRHLAGLAKLKISLEDLEFRAKQWATQHNGRSGRTARQFIDFLQGELALNK
ncbi:MAG: ATP-binding protein [Microcystis aeruginosa G11-06]|nr:ATP-binding protein [Microcystis aeruginosa G11-06]